MKLILVVVVLIMIEEVVTKKCSEAPGVDGCSVPDWIPGKKKFNEPCYKHDVCYACGTALNVSRIDCDRRFLTNCKNKCGKRKACNRAAGWYYRAVRWFAAFAYQTTSKEWCSEEWVPKCML